MADQADPLTELLYIIDEMRETTNLIRVQETLREGHRPWWRTFLFAFIRTGRDASADLAVQYLGENIDRARDHWREALRMLGELRSHSTTDDFVMLLDRELQSAGLNDVLPRLAHDAIPGPRKQAGEHLSAVVDTIRRCTQLVLGARNQLTLQRMRDAES